MRAIARVTPLVAALTTALACSHRTPPPPPIPPGARTIAELPSETLATTSVGASADVVVDRHGWPHVYASSLRDAAFAEGLAMARDRMPQMELFRRTASGRLAQIFGGVSAKFIESDLTMRTIGLRRMAQAIWERTPPGRTRDLFEGFAAGVNEYLREVHAGEVRAPRGSELLITDATIDWSPVDSLSVLRLMELFLSFNADAEINHTLLRDRARAVFENADPATAPALAARRGFISDVMRYEPPSTANVVPGFYAAARTRTHRRSSLARADLHRAPALALASLRRVLPAANRIAVGTNAWAVAGAHTASGHALLANDPHLPLVAPTILWGVHLVVRSGPDAMDVTGTAFPGVPGVVFGFNSRVAWGITNGMFDQMDVYDETISPGVNGAPDTVLFQGRQVPIETRVEQIPNGLFGERDFTIETVPHHGPILPTFVREGEPAHRTGTHALSVRWLAAEPTREIDSILALMFVGDVDAAQTAVRDAEVPGLGFIFADSAGNVAYRATGRVPIRAPGALTFDPVTRPDGTLPAAVLPGTGEAEWIGFVDTSSLPHVASGDGRAWVVSANNDPAGLSRGGNPFARSVYLGYDWAEGFRAERVAQRLDALGDQATREDMASIQADHVMLVAGRFRPFLLAAIARVQDEWTRPGTHPELTAVATEIVSHADLVRDVSTRLTEWSLDSPTGLEPGAPDSARRDAIATSIFHAWIAHVLDLALSDEMAALHDATAGSVSPVVAPRERMIATLFLLEHPERALTLDRATGQSTLWDDLRTTNEIETRDVILLRALVAAEHDLTLATMSVDRDHWTWGSLHTVRFASVLPHFSLALFADLAIPPADDPNDPNGFPRPGGIDTVDQGWPALQDANGTPAAVFNYTQGPARRVSIEMTPNGPIAFDALPGGESGDLASPHFRDEAADWRANHAHALYRSESDVAANAESRTQIVPAR